MIIVRLTEYEAGLLSALVNGIANNHLLGGKEGHDDQKMVNALLSIADKLAGAEVQD